MQEARQRQLNAEHADVHWATTAVEGRFPSGTDPLAAIREVMVPFMERTDGSNAVPWWNQARWWHGGGTGLKQGDVLLPPSETGIVPALVGTDKTSVYITTNRDKAILYAAPFEFPAIYEVTVTDEPQPDDVVDDKESWRVPRAKVWRRESIPTRELFRARRALNRPTEVVCPPLEVVELGKMKPIE